jgi:hypothetical protein
MLRRFRKTDIIHTYRVSFFQSIGASIHDKLTRLDSLFVVTGEEFVDHFTLFSGKVMNAKVQLKLPNDIFNREISH